MSIITDDPTPPTDERSGSVEAFLTAAGIDVLTAAASPDEIDLALIRLRESLHAGIDDLSRAGIGRAAKIAMQAAGIMGAGPLVEAAIRKVPRGAGDDPPAGGTTGDPAPAALVRDDTPWEKQVLDVAGLLEETAAAIAKYVVIRPRLADATALYVGVSFAIKAVDILPILLVCAATMRAGKSTLATVLAHLLPRAVMVSSLTPAVLFRLVDQHNPSLIADEADAWLNDEQNELRGIFNSGHSRRTAAVARCAGDEHDVRIFSTFCPKALIMIGRPPATILDRSILIELRRKAASESVASLRLDRLEHELLPLRRRWVRWAADLGGILRIKDPAMPAGLNDRAKDNWRALLALADEAGGDWVQRARQAAIDSCGRADDDGEGIAIELLADCRDVFGDRTRIPSADLAKGLADLPDRPWADWSHGKPITPLKLAARLRPFDIKPRKERLHGKPTNAYNVADFREAWARYLPPFPAVPPGFNPEQSEQSEQTNVYAGQTRVSDSEQGEIRVGTVGTVGTEPTAGVPSVPTVPITNVIRSDSLPSKTPMFPGLVPSVPTNSVENGGSSQEEGGGGGDGDF